MGWYLIPAGLSFEERHRRANVFRLTIGPHGSNFDDVVKGRSIQREMTPQDLVGALLFLASPESDFISGQTYIVHGGAVMH